MTNKEGRDRNGEWKETLGFPELTNLRIKKNCLQLVEQKQSSMSASRKLYPGQEFKVVLYWEERGMKQKNQIVMQQQQHRQIVQKPLAVTLELKKSQSMNKKQLKCFLPVNGKEIGEEYNIEFLVFAKNYRLLFNSFKPPI